MLTTDKKEAYRDKLDAQLKEWGAKIDLLSAKAAKAKANAEIAASDGVDALKRKRDAAAAKLKELRDAGDDAWEDAKNGAERAFSDARAAIEAAVERFKS